MVEKAGLKPTTSHLKSERSFSELLPHVWSGYLELNQDYTAPDRIGCHTPPTL
jgi:hypothetical protein